MTTLSEIHPDQMLPVKVLELTRGQHAIIDPEDWPPVNEQWAWWAAYDPKGNTWYVRGRDPLTGKETYLHILLTGHSRVDHINGNGLDNRRINLRFATQSQNIANSRMSKNNTSGFKGVTWYEYGCKWKSSIWVNRHRIHLGIYDDAEDAARAYDHAAVKYFGEYARTNVMMGLVDHDACDLACPYRNET